MRAFSASDLLSICENGASASPVEQALAILRAGFPRAAEAALLQLTVGQRDACLLRLRELTFGPSLTGLADCPACGERLEACLLACVAELPEGIDFTVPEGGMNVWVRLPASMDASELARRASNLGVRFMAGQQFAVSRPHSNELRLSFAGLDPARIRQGVAILARLIREERARPRAGLGREPAPAVV